VLGGPQPPLHSVVPLDHSKWVRVILNLRLQERSDIFNSLWLIVPTLIVFQLGKDISTALHVAAAKSKKLVNGKTN
jgi:hypothetical protein